MGDSGRRALLERRLFALKRFDSADYTLTSDRGRPQYLEEIRRTDEYERQHQLSHEHFETHSPPGPTRVSARHQLSKASSPSAVPSVPAAVVPPVPAAIAADLGHSGGRPRSAAPALSASRGRKELLERRLFALKRFDSAEYTIARRQGHQAEYLGELEETDQYEKRHHLTHEHFVVHSPPGPPRMSLQHPLQHNTRLAVPEPAKHTAEPPLQPSPATSQGSTIAPPPSARLPRSPRRQIAQQPPSQPQAHVDRSLGPGGAAATAAKAAMLRRKLAHTRRFDSGDYFASQKPEEDIVGAPAAQNKLDGTVTPAPCGRPPIGPPRAKPAQRDASQLRSAQTGSLQASSLQRAEGARASDQTAAKLTELGSVPEPKTAAPPSQTNAMLARFLQKRGARKRWDSADYNALLAGQSGAPALNAKPDLDVMSVSSADQTDGETKSEDPYGSASESSLAASRESLAHKRSAGNLSEANCSGGARAAPVKLCPPTRPPPALPAASDRGSVRLSHSAAQQHFLHHQKRSRRFDSADYFRGMGKPSHECEDGPLEAPLSPRQSLGKSTLALRDLRGARKRREQDMAIS